ncbi:hypothetical protein AMC99_01552 [Altererythrobacter epoxidivorans]|uniref:Uncharacterized protein n=2 Tax=Altererythrobacter epoxidivorans TaxID=361183 RepID=A0A0M5KYN0_9SPHN|nr:hypothetical protein AMC99_01552 [Altererythrobacter epoxidivorans]
MIVGLEDNAYLLTLKRRDSDQESKRSNPDGFIRYPEDEEDDRGAKLFILTVGTFLAVVFYLGYKALDDMGATAPASLEPPRIELAVNDDQGSGADTDHFVEISKRLSDRLLASSMVSRPYTEQIVGKDADYLLSITFDTDGDGVSKAYLALEDSENDVLYNGTINVDPQNESQFRNDLQAALVYLTAPNGIIANEERKTIIGQPKSGYQCFLAIEGRRTQGSDASTIVDRCLADFPDSDYRSFWLARRAFNGFQQLADQGKPVSKSAAPWRSLKLALDADPRNPYANFVAAKVELAEGNCDEAKLFIERAEEKGISYPTLIAAMEADASACPNIVTSSNARQLVTSMIEQNPSPDPLLQLYLVVSALAAEDIEAARMIEKRRNKDLPEGRIASTGDLLGKAIRDPAFAENNEDTLAKSLSVFVWDKRAVRKMIETAKNQT